MEAVAWRWVSLQYAHALDSRQEWHVRSPFARLTVTCMGPVKMANVTAMLGGRVLIVLIRFALAAAVEARALVLILALVSLGILDPSANFQVLFHLLVRKLGTIAVRETAGLVDVQPRLDGVLLEQ